MTSASTTPARRHRKPPQIERQFAGGGKSDFQLLGVLVPDDPEARTVLRQEAAKRGLSVEGILRRVVDIVIEDHLFAAVLDDAREIARRRR